ncbi:MAG: aminotransferase class V-fold PLP-dependent enzyme [Chloroflexota bacterium]|nr:aminotransferase class V-fold PLP-dependent enzyme [Chloroflexota bacterium]
MNSLEKYFLLDPNVVFLNHGSFGATPKPVFREYQRWQRELEKQPVEFLGRRATMLMAEARMALGKYLGTNADNVIYTQNVTISLNIVARSLELGTGDEVLTTNHEYGAMDRTWRFLSKERGFQYINHAISTPIETEESFVEDFWRGVTPHTRIIFISHLTSPTAIIFPVKELIRRAREAGILTIIDGAHVPGQLPLHLDSLGADFYGGNLHKWLCAPKGAGFLYARPEVQRLVKPLVVSWGEQADIPSGSQFVDDHEWWGTRDLAAFLSVPAAIEFQEKYNWDEVRDACHALARAAQHRICELTGLAPLHPDSDGWFRQMIAAPLPADTDIVSLKKRLYDEHQIEVPLIEWFPSPTLGQGSGVRVGNKLIRVSVQGYNTQGDVDTLCHALSLLLG